MNAAPSDIVLHHYPMSTFSEKVRLACGLKRLAYRQVEVPIASPKPDLTALTGGYRRAPVMQIGADIFCDSHLILRELERRVPAPSLFPGGSEGQATALAWWAERDVFMPALGFIAFLNGDLYDADFVDERRRFGYTLDREELRPLFPRHVQQLCAHLEWLAAMLADGRPFLLGAEPSAADIAAYPSLWFLEKWGGDETPKRLPVAPLRDWIRRVAEIGYGTPTDITGAAALEIARTATPEHLRIAPDADPTGIAAGTTVTMTPDDVGRDPVRGILVAADRSTVVLERTDPSAGTVHVHFPRAGYDLVAA